MRSAPPSVISQNGIARVCTGARAPAGRARGADPRRASTLAPGTPTANGSRLASDGVYIESTLQSRRREQPRTRPAPGRLSVGCPHGTLDEHERDGVRPASRSSASVEHRGTWSGSAHRYGWDTTAGLCGRRGCVERVKVGRVLRHLRTDASSHGLASAPDRAADDPSAAKGPDRDARLDGHLTSVAEQPLHRALGLTDGELDRIRELLGRDPNHFELAVFSLLWSEHCGYKHSALLLQAAALRRASACCRGRARTPA